LLSCRLKVVPH